jgi:transposase
VVIDDVLFDGLDVTVEQTEVLSDVIVVSVTSASRPGRCPDCRWRARRQHSTYRRRLTERPVAGRQVRVLLRVRRFFCDRDKCPRTTFVEQIDGLTEPFRRSSIRLTGWLRHITVKLGGPGRRTALPGTAAGRRTDPAAGTPSSPAGARARRACLGWTSSPSASGVTYGTLLVDVETGRVVDEAPRVA